MKWTILFIGILLSGILFMPAEAALIDTGILITKLSWLPNDLKLAVIQETKLQQNLDGSLAFSNGLIINSMTINKKDNLILVTLDIKGTQYELQRDLALQYSGQLYQPFVQDTLIIKFDDIISKDDLYFLLGTDIITKWNEAKPITYGGIIPTITKVEDNIKLI